MCVWTTPHLGISPSHASPNIQVTPMPATWLKRTFKIAYLAVAAAPLVLATTLPATAQSMLDLVDLKSPAFTQAEMTRGDIEAAIAKLAPGATLDLSAKSLNGLDLSGLDLTRTRLQSTRLNNAKLVKANLAGVMMDQAWALGADLTEANLTGASLFGTQLVGAKADRANFTGSRIAGDFSKASLTGATFDKADLSADMKNQSMGLMRGVFNSSNLEGASFAGANLSRVQMEFASLRGASLVGAKFNGSEIAGVDFTGADVSGADFEEADVTSTRLLGLKNAGKALNLDKVKNADRAFRE